jgi:hypothetical protein
MHFAQRIIQATSSKQQISNSDTLHWLCQLFKGVLHLEPGYVMALTLLLGLIEGYFITGAIHDAQSQYNQQPAAYDFFYSERPNP